MTVRELIEVLADLPPNALVLAEDTDGYQMLVRGVRPVEIASESLIVDADLSARLQIDYQTRVVIRVTV